MGHWEHATDPDHDHCVPCRRIHNEQIWLAAWFVGVVLNLCPTSKRSSCLPLHIDTNTRVRTFGELIASFKDKRLVLSYLQQMLTLRPELKKTRVRKELHGGPR